ncbi:hypothetical protein FRC16_005984, partial [Serendipita sp. 398]
EVRGQIRLWNNALLTSFDAQLVISSYVVDSSGGKYSIDHSRRSLDHQLVRGVFERWRNTLLIPFDTRSAIR